MRDVGTMTMEQISIRLEPELSARAEKLAEALAARSEFKAFRMTKAAALRMAMLEGLSVLERKYAIPEKPDAPTKKR